MKRPVRKKRTKAETQPVVEVEPEAAPETRLEIGQELGFLSDSGEQETWTVAYVDTQHFGFLTDGEEGNIQTVQERELQVDEATLALAQTADWDEALEAATKGKVKGGAVAARKYLTSQKGRLLRRAALSALEKHPNLGESSNPDAQKLVVQEALTRVLKEAREQHGEKTNPRILAAEQAEAVAQYATLIDASRNAELLNLSAKDAKKQEAELISALKDLELHEGLRAKLRTVDVESLDTEEPDSPADKLDVAAAQGKAEKGWSDLRVAAHDVQEKLKEDPSSFELQEMIDNLTRLYHVAIADTVLHDVARAEQPEHERSKDALDTKSANAVRELIDQLHTKMRMSSFDIDNADATAQTKVDIEIGEKGDDRDEPWQQVDVEELGIEIDDRDAVPAAVSIEIPEKPGVPKVEDESRASAAQTSSKRGAGSSKSNSTAAAQKPAAQTTKKPQQSVSISENADAKPSKSFFQKMKDWWKFLTE